MPRTECAGSDRVCRLGQSAQARTEGRMAHESLRSRASSSRWIVFSHSLSMRYPSDRGSNTFVSPFVVVVVRNHHYVIYTTIGTMPDPCTASQMQVVMPTCF